MEYLRAFLPSILGLLAALMTARFGVSKTQLVLTAFTFTGCLLLTAKWLALDDYRMANLPVLAACIVFALIGVRGRKA